MYITADMNEDLTTDLKISKRNAMCVGCGCQILDQYILRVAPDLEWHATCLRCVECGQYLDENCTCFVRNGRTYCKSDYLRLFSRNCAKCKHEFSKNDLVMKANHSIYHYECFRCYVCNKKLSPGDEFCVRDEGIICKMDNDMIESQQAPQYALNMATAANAPANASPLINPNNTANSVNNNTTCQNITNMQMPTHNSNNKMLNIKCDEMNSIQNEYSNLSPHSQNNHHHLQQIASHLSAHPQPTSPRSLAAMSHHPHHLANTNQNTNPNMNSRIVGASVPGMNVPGGNSMNQVINNVSSNQNGLHHHRKDKTTRVRTVLNEKQLHTLRTCYGANPRPDALMKEQLVEMTGLSPRVIRVWFQNKRCKDKKKSIMIKQMQEQQKNRQSIGHGISMVATSPMQNDLSNLGPANQIEIQSTSGNYQQNPISWKALNEYNLNGQNGGDMANLLNNNRMNNNGMRLPHQNSYDQMMNFASDEDDCFDNLSDHVGDDSISSVGLDDTRIQQL